MADQPQRKRRHKLELDEPVVPHHYVGVANAIKIKPTLYGVCAICWWSHATLSLNDNAYHEPCLKSMMREYHPAPDQLAKEGKA